MKEQETQWGWLGRLARQLSDPGADRYGAHVALRTFGRVHLSKETAPGATPVMDPHKASTAPRCDVPRSAA